MLHAVDLCSYMGGMSLALRPFVKTIIYCENDPYCQRVLYERIKNGDLEKAPIHNDPSTLFVSGSPNMLISRGIEHYINVLEHTPSIKTVFLECLPNTLYNRVLNDFIDKGFDVVWTTRSAADHGAPHGRSRIFVLAVHETCDFKTFDHVDLLMSADEVARWWLEEPCERVTMKTADSYDKNWIKRSRSLGGEVVPSVAQSAFAELVTTFRHVETYVKMFPSNSREMCNPINENGLVYKGVFYTMPKSQSKKRHQINVQITLPNGSKRTLDNFPTPRKSITHPSALNNRSIRDLPTVLVNASDISPQDEHIPNIRYIEWLMGFPEDWSKCHEPKIRETIQKKEKERVPTGTSLNKKADKRYTNGMHIFMREHPGKSVTEIAKLWRELSTEVKSKYKASKCSYQTST